MNRLSQLLPFNGKEETVASYASRLSAACGYRHARSFGADLGFRFQALAVGADEAVAKFAEVLDLPVRDFLPGVVRSDDRMNFMRGEALTRTLVQRQRLRYCPHCVQEDEETREGRRGFRAFGRVEWLVLPIRTCSIHYVRLITADHEPVPMFTHDFAGNLAVEAENMKKHTQGASLIKPDALQRYVERRIRGESTPTWLDTLPLYVVARVAEAVGAMAWHGIRFKKADIDEEEWSACAGDGYQIMVESEQSFRDFLQTLLRRFFDRRGDTGGRALLGRLYEMLAHETADPAFDPIREIMKDEAISSLPLGPGDEFFGFVTERRLHSVQSAAAQFDIHPKRLRKLLINKGMVAEGNAGFTMERMLVDAETMERFALQAKASMDVPEAREHLGVSRPAFEVLIEHGFLKPHGRGSAHAVDRRCLVADLDDLLSRLESSITCGATDEMVDITSAGRRANCSLQEIFSLLLDRRLDRVAGVGERITFSAIRVDPAEVKEKTRLPEHSCYSLRNLERLLPAKSSVVKALVADGHLPSITVRNPAKRSLQRVVEPEALDRFRREFASLGNLARQYKTRTWSLERRLKEKGVAPIFNAGGFPFYRRREAEPFCGKDTK